MTSEHTDFVNVGDRTALVCDNGPDAGTLRSVLSGLGFKCHAAESPERAVERIRYNGYDVIAVAENFAGSTLRTNGVLNYLRPQPMEQRRNSYVFLVGQSFRTLDAMQAYAQSVHLVVNSQDLINLEAVLKKGIADFEMFYQVFRAVGGEMMKARWRGPSS